MRFHAAKQTGFTLVELLVVIVVVAILASISVVSYTGMQNRAKTSAGEQLAAQVVNKAQAFHTFQSVYPAAGANSAATIANFNAVDEARLTDNVQFVSGTLSALNASTAQGGKAVHYRACGTSPNFTGAAVSYWSYSTAAAVTLTTGTGC